MEMLGTSDFASDFLRQFARRVNSINQARLEEGDSMDADGLIVCGKCMERKQCQIMLGGEKITVPCVCRCRREELEAYEQRMRAQEAQRAAESLRTASLMTDRLKNANFGKYVVREGNKNALQISQNYVERFETMKKKNLGLLFYGPVGTGKSFTAACIANALLEQCRTVIVTSFVKLLHDFRNTEAEERFFRILDRAQLVIIDDLGTERNTDFAVEKVYNVIDSRVRANKPLILTTNLELAEIEHTQDARYERIYDRILEVCLPVELKGNSFRMTQATIRRKHMRDLLS